MSKKNKKPVEEKKILPESSRVQSASSKKQESFDLSDIIQILIIILLTAYIAFVILKYHNII